MGRQHGRTADRPELTEQTLRKGIDVEFSL